MEIIGKNQSQLFKELSFEFNGNILILHLKPVRILGRNIAFKINHGFIEMKFLQYTFSKSGKVKVESRQVDIPLPVDEFMEIQYVMKNGSIEMSIRLNPLAQSA